MKFEFVPWPNFADRMLNELNSGGKLCDLMIGDSQWIGGAAENGQYVKLNDFFDANGITLVSPLELNGGSIADGGGTPATDLTFTLPDTSGIRIQTYTTAFTTSPITSANANAVQVPTMPAPRTSTWRLMRGRRSVGLGRRRRCGGPCKKKLWMAGSWGVLAWSDYFPCRGADLPSSRKTALRHRQCSARITPAPGSRAGG
mgnify:CR=1 FL=1